MRVHKNIDTLQLPGIVFARGGAVAILMLLESEKGTYVVLTEQVE